MGLFDVLMAGGQMKQEYEDFARRFEQGPPSEGYSDQEVLKRYSGVAHEASPTEYEGAVKDALSRLSPAEQAAFVRELQERARGRSVPVPSAAPGGGLDDLARSIREIHEQPGRLREVMTGPASTGSGGTPAGMGEVFSSPLAKAAIAGITAMLVRRVLAPK